MRMLAILLVVAFVLSVTPVVVFADCAGHTAQAQLVKSQPKEKLSTDKSESPVLIAQDESKQKTPEKKQ